MSYVFSEELLEYVESKSLELNIVPVEKRNPKFNHITISIKSLSEYMKFVEILNDFNDIPGQNLAFRGVSSDMYSLSPSLKVSQDMNESSFDFGCNIENRLVDEMISARPEEFSGITSDFDILAKMQHLGLSTRLLDFSLNPLVALYFACESMSNETGRVVCTYDTSSAYTKNIVERICGTYKFPEFAEVYLEDLLGDELGIKNYMASNLEPIMAHPKCISERIRRQSGIFMVFPNNISDGAWFNIANRGDGFRCVPYDGQRGVDLLNRIKEKEDPYEIYEINRKDLLIGHSFVVTPDTFYRLDKSYGAPKDFWSERGQELCANSEMAWAFKNRFKIEEDIAPIPSKVMAENFCSILIDAKYKKSIMKDLNHVNINEAFLFPEPEYTAKRIKKSFFY